MIDNPLAWGVAALALGLYVFYRIMLRLVERDDLVPLECPLCGGLTRTWPKCERCLGDIDAFYEGLRREYQDMPEWRAPESPASVSVNPVVYGQDEVAAVRELLLDVVLQSCSDGAGLLTHWCISSYEDAIEYLERAGLVEDATDELHGERYRLTGNVTSEVRA